MVGGVGGKFGVFSVSSIANRGLELMTLVSRPYAVSIVSAPPEFQIEFLNSGIKVVNLPPPPRFQRKYLNYNAS